MSASEVARFEELGFHVVPGLLRPDEVESFTRHLEGLSGRSREQLGKARRGAAGLSVAWNCPDGVSRHPEFWALIDDPRLVETARLLLGEVEIRYLQHSDLHVGFAAVSWHRDSVQRRLGGSGDWDESVAPYRLLRVGLYLQTFAESGAALGLIPGSHRPALHPSRERRRQEGSTGLVAFARARLSGRDPLGAQATWIRTEPGDAIFFDPRVLHAGAPIVGPKFSVFLGYGVPSLHFDRHASYYRYLRRDLGYADLDPVLRERLRRSGLWAGETPRIERIPGAWVPPRLQAIAGRRLR